MKLQKKKITYFSDKIINIPDCILVLSRKMVNYIHKIVILSVEHIPFHIPVLLNYMTLYFKIYYITYYIIYLLYIIIYTYYKLKYNIVVFLQSYQS